MLFFTLDRAVETAFSRERVDTTLSAGDLAARVLLLKAGSVVLDGTKATVLPVSMETALVDLSGFEDFVLFTEDFAAFRVAAGLLMRWVPTEGVADLILFDRLAVEVVLFRSSSDEVGNSKTSGAC